MAEHESIMFRAPIVKYRVAVAKRRSRPSRVDPAELGAGKLART